MAKKSNQRGKGSAKGRQKSPVNGDGALESSSVVKGQQQIILKDKNRPMESPKVSRVNAFRASNSPQSSLSSIDDSNAVKALLEQELNVLEQSGVSTAILAEKDLAKTGISGNSFDSFSNDHENSLSGLENGAPLLNEVSMATSNVSMKTPFQSHLQEFNDSKSSAYSPKNTSSLFSVSNLDSLTDSRAETILNAQSNKAVTGSSDDDDEVPLYKLQTQSTPSRSPSMTGRSLGLPHISGNQQFLSVYQMRPLEISRSPAPTEKSSLMETRSSRSKRSSFALPQMERSMSGQTLLSPTIESANEQESRRVYLKELFDDQDSFSAKSPVQALCLETELTEPTHASVLQAEETEPQLVTDLTAPMLEVLSDDLHDSGYGKATASQPSAIVAPSSEAKELPHAPGKEIRVSMTLSEEISFDSKEPATLSAVAPTSNFDSKLESRRVYPGQELTHPAPLTPSTPAVVDPLTHDNKMTQVPTPAQDKLTLEAVSDQPSAEKRSLSLKRLWKGLFSGKLERDEDQSSGVDYAAIISEKLVSLDIEIPRTEFGSELTQKIEAVSEHYGTTNTVPYTTPIADDNLKQTFVDYEKFSEFSGVQFNDEMKRLGRSLS